jgi:hypothetical protein
MVSAVWRDDPADSLGDEAVSTTYLASAALAWLDIAQKQIDASAVFARYRALSRRRPGLALRGLVR